MVHSVGLVFCELVFTDMRIVIMSHVFLCLCKWQGFPGLTGPKGQRGERVSHHVELINPLQKPITTLPCLQVLERVAEFDAGSVSPHRGSLDMS